MVHYTPAPVHIVSTITQPQQTATQQPITPVVPFYSQFKDITSTKWQKVSCGIVSLAMIIDFYKPNTIAVNTLLSEGIATGAYDNKAGWSYKGLIAVSKKYGLDGTTYDYGKTSAATALTHLKASLKDGPVIASVHYKFNPKSTIPHLVVITSIDGETVHYNDPAAKTGDLKISLAVFTKSWKQRFIVVRPTA
jgi:ABC-type bacteriocin/lantibiotic exporter with double-glycine peptidase domain